MTTPDVSTLGRALFSETLNGLKSVAVSGDGIFLDEAAQEGRPHTVAMQADPEVALLCQQGRKLVCL